MRKQLTSAEKEIIGLRCCNCGTDTDLQYHHILPLELGGNDILSNMCCMCYTCHSKIHFGKSKNINHSELTKKGIQNAKKEGKRIGNPKGCKLVTKKSLEAKEKIKQYSKSFGGSFDDAETIKLIGISRKTFYKYKKEIKQ